MISIVLADNHHVVRQAMRALLEEEPDFDIIGEAGDKETAINLVNLKPPTVLVLDLTMRGGLDCLDVIRHVSEHSPETGVVVLSTYDNEGYILESLRAGAKSYVLKHSTSEELKRAIREVAVGHRYLGLPMSEQAINFFMEKFKASDFDLYDTLTNREREVLNLVAQGYTNTEIAAKLFVSPRTVEVHRANMMRKLRLRNHTKLVQYALERKILQSTS